MLWHTFLEVAANDTHLINQGALHELIIKHYETVRIKCLETEEAEFKETSITLILAIALVYEVNAFLAHFPVWLGHTILNAHSSINKLTLFNMGVDGINNASLFLTEVRPFPNLRKFLEVNLLSLGKITSALETHIAYNREIGLKETVRKMGKAGGEAKGKTKQELAKIIIPLLPDYAKFSALTAAKYISKKDAIQKFFEIGVKGDEILRKGFCTYEKKGYFPMVYSVINNSRPKK